MVKRSKILLVTVLLLIFVSVSATFYQSVILQDLELAGVGVEVGEDYSYAWFIHNQKEYEFEVESTNFQDLLDKIENEVDTADPDLLAQIEAAYLESVEE